MLDAPLRRLAGPAVERAGEQLARAGVRPLWLTGGGFALGAAACAAVAARRFDLALGLWLANRVLDALDGAVARAVGSTERGAFLDIVADFAVYSGFVAGLAVALPAARLACAALLAAYSLSGTAFLALSSLLERRGTVSGDGRSLHFVGGLAEGSETVVVYGLFCLLPVEAAVIAWAFAAAVALTALQRVVLGARLLAPATARGRHPAAPRAGRRASTRRPVPTPAAPAGEQTAR